MRKQNIKTLNDRNYNEVITIDNKNLKNLLFNRFSYFENIIRRIRHYSPFKEKQFDYINFSNTKEIDNEQM